VVGFVSTATTYHKTADEAHSLGEPTPKWSFARGSGLTGFTGSRKRGAMSGQTL
jgi:hypothetical protein